MHHMGLLEKKLLGVMTRMSEMDNMASFVHTGVQAKHAQDPTGLCMPASCTVLYLLVVAVNSVRLVGWAGNSVSVWCGPQNVYMQYNIALNPLPSSNSGVKPSHLPAVQMTHNWPERLLLVQLVWGAGQHVSWP